MKETDREQQQVIAAEKMRSHDHQSLDLNRNMHKGNEVLDNASLLCKEGSTSVSYPYFTLVQIRVIGLFRGREADR